MRVKPVPMPNRPTNSIQCRVGYVTMKHSIENTSNTTHPKEINQEVHNEKVLEKINEIRQEIDKTQLRFTQEIHRLTINLSKMIEK